MFRRVQAALPDRAYQLFLLALAVMLEHLLEDALVHEENGSSLAALLGSSALTVALVAVGVVLYPLLRRARPVLVGLYGLLALSGGWKAHVTDTLDGNATGGDYSGVVYALAGVAMLGLAAKLAGDLVRPRRSVAQPSE
jgi:hypothetical protein